MKPTSLLKKAKTFCATHHYRFTDPRERVLSLLIDTHEAMGAYQIIDALSSDQIKINPPTVYRAIEFWHTHGFIHRVERWHAAGTHITPMRICLFVITATPQSN